MAQSPRRRSGSSRRQATANTVGLQLLSAIITDVSVSTLREIDPDLHLSKEQDSPEHRAYDYMRSHHDQHQVLPSVQVLADNTGIVLPEVDQPASYYFRRVRERGLSQNVFEPYNRLQQGLQNPRNSMADIESAIDELSEIKNRFLYSGTGIDTSDALLHSLQEEMIERRMSSGSMRGITTGFGEVDFEMDGYNPGDLVVWVGRPGRSKSWFLLKQCHAAWMAGYKPLYISMEMGAEQNMRRILGIHTGVNPTFIRKGQIQTLARPGLDRGIAELLERRPLHMVTANFSRTVDQIASFIDTHNPDIVYIDAGYLLSPRKKRFGAGGRRETISDVIEELKELAANSNRPFVLTVQFNRQAEHRRRAGGAGEGENFNPIAHLSLAEIGETDVIGQTATHVLGIEFPPAPIPQNDARAFGFLKGREGESGWWLTRFIKSQSSPVNLDLIPRDDPIYAAVLRFARENSSGRGGRDPRTVDPAHRTRLMQINQPRQDAA
jgi:replicative DNA helicase